eukprot:PLAT12570.1.p1 GENE.PLAT12570.1~~PLAT12570.1.p1  ORF type:complete len:491 (+),score=212.78 PLAT12570.1:79-1551(+)
MSDWWRVQSEDLFAQRWDKHVKGIHKHALRSMRPVVGQEPPPEFPHIKRNLKKQLKLEERCLEIESHNRLLLQRVSTIMRRQPKSDKRRKKFLSDMKRKHKQRRIRELQRINEENQALLKRLRTARPVYSAKKWQASAHKQRYFRDVLSKAVRRKRVKKMIRPLALTPAEAAAAEAAGGRTGGGGGGGHGSPSRSPGRRGAGRRGDGDFDDLSMMPSSPLDLEAALDDPLYATAPPRRGRRARKKGKKKGKKKSSAGELATSPIRSAGRSPAAASSYSGLDAILGAPGAPASAPASGERAWMGDDAVRLPRPLGEDEGGHAHHDAVMEAERKEEAAAADEARSPPAAEASPPAARPKKTVPTIVRDGVMRPSTGSAAAAAGSAADAGAASGGRRLRRARLTHLGRRAMKMDGQLVVVSLSTEDGRHMLVNYYNPSNSDVLETVVPVDDVAALLSLPRLTAVTDLRKRDLQELFPRVQLFVVDGRRVVRLA